MSQGIPGLLVSAYLQGVSINQGSVNQSPEYDIERISLRYGMPFLSANGKEVRRVVAVVADGKDGLARLRLRWLSR